VGGGIGVIQFDEQTLWLIEWGALALGLVNIALLIFRSIWNFAFGIVSVAFASFVLYERKLYGESSLQWFFVAAQLWSWWLWHKVGDDDNRVPVRWLDWPSRIVWLVGIAALALNLGWAMDRFTDATVPYADAGITGASIAAQFLLGFRRIENWLIWIVVDIASVVLFIDRELYALAGLYGGMLVMCLFGLKEWIEAERRQRAEGLSAA
jgi:nicotinamide mononucleotide transporter